MYAFPKDFDASVFIGRKLEMICFNANQIYFHFDNGVHICVETAFFHERRPQNFSVMIPVPAMESNLMELLEKRVSSAHTEGMDILTLVFEEEDVLRFEAIANYESYSIVTGETTILI